VESIQIFNKNVAEKLNETKITLHHLVRWLTFKDEQILEDAAAADWELFEEIEEFYKRIIHQE
jgi:hypothetical protein